MNTLYAILGGIVILAIAVFFCIVAAIMQSEICEDCPYKKECDAHKSDYRFRPECFKRRSMLPHHPMENLL